MDKIDVYNDSAIILDRRTPKSIISWLTILIVLLVFFSIIIFIPFNIYKSYAGYISIDDNNTYITLNLDESDFPISKKDILYIKDNKYNYKIVSINNNNVMLKANLNSDIEIENNIVLVNILKQRTTLYRILKNKIKKGFGL